MIDVARCLVSARILKRKRKGGRAKREEEDRKVVPG